MGTNHPENRGALSVNKFCEWASIGRSTCYQEAKAGRLTLRKVGFKTVITMSEATRWVEALPQASQPK